MNNKWTKEETIIAFNVYCKIPFKESSKTHPVIVRYAKILGRSPSALNMKVGNLGRLDKDLHARGITGLKHGAKMEEEVWNEFYGDPERLAFESERLLAVFSKKSIEESSGIDVMDLPKGEDRMTLIKQRVNQSFFRQTVLSSYNFTCCISGVSNPNLVEACHISDWADDISNRTNPQNGLCLNPFFHRAYDKFLIGISPDMKVSVSDEVMETTKEESFKSYLMGLKGKRIYEPDKFMPRRELLEMHFQKFRANAGC